MNEQELIRLCLKNDRNAQRELFRRYGPLMMGICYRYAGQAADAEDLLQEGFIKVFTNLHKFRVKAPWAHG